MSFMTVEIPLTRKQVKAICEAAGIDFKVAFPSKYPEWGTLEDDEMIKAEAKAEKAAVKFIKAALKQ